MMDQSEYAIRILQWNAQGISTSKEDLLKPISEYEPRVIAIQETFLAGDVKVKLGDLIFIVSKAASITDIMEV